MTRNDLEKLRSLKFEIAQLEEELKKPQEPSEVIIAYKDYRNSAKGIPKVDRGLDDGTEVKKKLVDSLQKKLNERIRLANAMESWIDEIKDPEMRVILRMYYGRGCNQKEIAQKLGYERSTIAKKLKRFDLGIISCNVRK